VRLAAVRRALERAHGAAVPTLWDWHLESGIVQWDARLQAVFGYRERVTDAAWRESRIHPDDRERVILSLQRATIVNHGSPWSEEYRFRQSDDSYVLVRERAYVVADEAGPCRVLGALAPSSPVPRRRRR
jgi:PAS domain-containing protein